MAVTYTDIFDDVCERLGNMLEPKSAEFPGDGVAEILHLPDKHIVVGSETVYLIQDDGTTVTYTHGVEYDLDYASGYVDLISGAVVVDTTLMVDYRVRHWSESLLWRVINNGIHYCYPNFYATATVTPTIDDSGDYPVEDPDGRVIGGVIEVEDVGSPTYHLSPFRDYRVLRGEDESVSLRLYQAAVGTVTVKVAVHPDEFAATTTTLADLGLPDRMREPLVLYAQWKALSSKMPPRSRQDNVTTLNAEGKTTFFDQARMIQMAKAELDTELEANKMRYWEVYGK